MYVKYILILAKKWSNFKILIFFKCTFKFCRSLHKDNKYECTQCKTLFDSKDNLMLHQKTTQHSSSPVEENTEMQEPLERLEIQSIEQDTSTAMIKEDSSNTIHMCEKCDKHFELKQEYELHMRVVHELQKFTCNVCNKDFTNQSNLKMHMNTHKVCIL